jgi:ComF family protein
MAAAIDLLYPPRCAACDGECEPRVNGPLFCPTCDTSLAISQRPTCPRCALVCSEADLPRGSCGDCHSRKLLFAAARTIGPYQAELQQAVLKAKHSVYEPLAAALGQRLAEAVRERPLPERPDLVAAVPMHWLKRLWRKTNPASTVAQAVARELEVPLAKGLLVCTRMLRRQATLTPPERRRNVRGAFRASRRWKISGQQILLVDDVMTTGATAHEASRVLLEVGALAVYVATVARSSPEF